MGCQLADTFALVVQGLLGVLALLSLVYKRVIETPPRPLTVWLMDTSKQVRGGGRAWTGVDGRGDGRCVGEGRVCALMACVVRAQRGCWALLAGARRGVWRGQLR